MPRQNFDKDLMPLSIERDPLFSLFTPPYKTLMVDRTADGQDYADPSKDIVSLMMV
jgi:hypothetical protein